MKAWRYCFVKPAYQSPVSEKEISYCCWTLRTARADSRPFTFALIVTIKLASSEMLTSRLMDSVFKLGPACPAKFPKRTKGGRAKMLSKAASREKPRIEFRILAT